MESTAEYMNILRDYMAKNASTNITVSVGEYSALLPEGSKQKIVTLMFIWKPQSLICSHWYI